MEEESKKGNVDIPRPILIPLILLVIWAIIHAIQTRTADDFLKYSLYISAIASVIFIIILIGLGIQTGITRPTKYDFIMYGASLLALMLIGPFYYALGASIKDLYLWLQSPILSKNGTIVMTLIITSVLGVALFYFRLRARTIYGFTEAAIGLTVAANKVSSEISQTSITSNFYLAILTASVYLVVRGLDNIHQGLTKEPIDLYGLKILFFLKRGRGTKK